MPFQPVQPERLATAVAQQIELLILRGVLRPGERLPPERDLSDRLGVSRPSLREAIADLTDSGLLATRAGSGIYVADVLGGAFSPALVQLFARHEDALFDAIDFRRDIEGLAAARAATGASDTDLKVIASHFARMQSAHEQKNTQAEAQADAEFHMAIIEAAHNVVLLHMMRSMFDLLRQGVFYNRAAMFAQNTTRTALLDQHRAINDAIQAREGDAARAAVHAHLAFVADALRAHLRAQRNETTARQRFEHEATRS